MDYSNFKKEWNKNLEWERNETKQKLADRFERATDWYTVSDAVNSPSHYTRGRVEVIEIIEDAVQDAPEPYTAVLQGNILKYLLRLWVKDNPVQDAKKARWYLDRLIKRLEDDA